jgi:uncharacterized membrane protein
MSDRGLKIALGISLVANVFVIGGVLGAVYMRAHSPAGMHGPLGNPLARATDMLNPNDRDAFHQMLRAQIPTIRPLQQDSRAARRQAMEDMTAPTFDRAGAGALMARARADDEKARGQIEDAILDFAAKLAPDERAALAKGMRRGAMQRWMLRKGGHPDGAPPPERQP